MSVYQTSYLPFSNWSLKPLLGESARGYFLRLVANEGHYSATVYGNEVGINGRALFAEETLDTLLRLPIDDYHKASLRRFTPEGDGAYYNLGGQRLRQRQVTTSSRRFCRACLADQAYHRAWWDIVAFRTCPEHGIPIEDRDAAGQPIGWWWADIASDTDGNLLGKRSPSQADQHTRTLEAFILERLDVAPRKSWPLLDGYHLYEVIEACEYLGMWLGNERTFDVTADQPENLAIGMAALSGTWEDLVAAMRDWFMERVPSDIRRQGKMQSMGWAWNAWPTLPGTTIGSMLKRATTEAFEPIGKMGKKRFREERDFYAAKTLSPLAHDLDVKMDALLPLAHYLDLIPETAGEWELTPEQKSRLRTSVGNLVPSSEVSQILGLETWEWQGLVSSGLLTAFAGFALARMFLKSEVEKVLSDMIAIASRVQATSVSLRTFAKREGLAVSEVLAMILEGEIETLRVDEGQRGLSSIRVPKSFRLAISADTVDHDVAWRDIGVETDSVGKLVTGDALWAMFKAHANLRCPLFVIPETAPLDKFKIRTTTRKVALDVFVDREAGAIELGFDIHPTESSRRWKIFNSREAEVRETLGFMGWKRSTDQAGWRVSLTISGAEDVGVAVDALVGLHRLFK
ncbi:TniQ family protein [Hoeflea alexandrii]|uniref:TniQ family protein n=1 Tax=Hoeflea alexandrii TaxID=288436 RepID=UPI0035CF02FF